MSTIKGGVGYGQPNSPDDVRLIQQLLNQHIGKLNQQSRVAEDGRFGPNTARAIVEFQSKVLHHTKPDGVVGVAGPRFWHWKKERNSTKTRRCHGLYQPVPQRCAGCEGQVGRPGLGHSRRIRPGDRLGQEGNPNRLFRDQGKVRVR